VHEQSGGKLLSAPGAPARKNATTSLGCHAGAKSVPALSNQFAWLKGPLHLPDSIQTIKKGPSPATPSTARCIAMREGQVNRSQTAAAFLNRAKQRN